MPFDWRTALLGPPRVAPPPAETEERIPELAAAGLLAMLRSPGHTVELIEVIPHGGDLHLVTATVDGKRFRNYVFTGDIRGDEPAAQRRTIASRVRAQFRPDPAAGPALSGREVGLP